MTTSRVRSLRLRAVLVVVLAVLAPIVWVWSSGLAETGLSVQMSWQLDDAADRFVEDPTEAEDISKRFRGRLRVVDGDTVVIDEGRSIKDRVWEPMGNWFYGPDGRPVVASYDQRWGPLAERTEVVEARRTGEVERCELTEDGMLLVCIEVRALPDGRILHLQKGSGRAVRSLYDVRFQLTGLTVFLVMIGIVVGLLFGYTMVRPIEQLRDQVLERTEPPLSTQPIDLQRRDEIGELAAAFNDLLQAVDARDKANVAFAADMAHEMKNPVAAIQAAAEALEKSDDARTQRVRRILLDSTTRLDEVVSLFLDLARAEAGLSENEREPVPLDDLLKGLVDTASADPRHDSVTFDVDVAPATVSAAPERLETALNNLIINAASYAANGEQGRVSVASDANGRITIRDTGKGIAEADLPHVFERYFTTRDEGTGLGLPMARAIVEAHGGSIVAANHPEGGAVFTVTLPIEDA